MAKTQQNQTAPVVPNFRDIDKEAAARAQAALAGGRQDPLKVPTGTKLTVDKKGIQRWRWTEQVTVLEAYRSVTKKGLLDVTIIVKVRQSANAGGRVFGHFYLNMASQVPENHVSMNERSNGAIMSLLTVTGFMPAGGELRGSLLDKMFPPKGQPGTSSPLNNKVVVANIVQTKEPQKDPKTGKVLVDDEGEDILERRDGLESFLPVAGAVEADEDEDEDEEGEDAEEGEDEDEEEEEAPAPPPVKRKKQ